MTPKQKELLALLEAHKGEVVTRDAMLNALYGGMDEPRLKIIDVFICHIRKALPANQRIATVWGRGYRLEETCAAP